MDLLKAGHVTVNVSHGAGEPINETVIDSEPVFPEEVAEEEEPHHARGHKHAPSKAKGRAASAGRGK